MKTRIVSLVYEVTDADGTVNTYHLEDGDLPMGEIKFCFHPTVPKQQFWFASSHSGLMSGNAVIASTVPGEEFDQEKVKDRTNELIGKIRDGHCHVFCSYEIETPGMTITKELQK